MSREVVIGPKNNGPNVGKITVIVTFDDSTDVLGDADHVKVVIEDVPDEGPDDYIDRAASRAQELADELSKEISAGRYRQRPKKVSAPPSPL
jgi:hypothetical protein